MRGNKSDSSPHATSQASRGQAAKTPTVAEGFPGLPPPPLLLRMLKYDLSVITSSRFSPMPLRRRLPPQVPYASSWYMVPIRALLAILLAGCLDPAHAQPISPTIPRVVVVPEGVTPATSNILTPADAVTPTAAPPAALLREKAPSVLPTDINPTSSTIILWPLHFLMFGDHADPLTKLMPICATLVVIAVLFLPILWYVLITYPWMVRELTNRLDQGMILEYLRLYRGLPTPSDAVPATSLVRPPQSQAATAVVLIGGLFIFVAAALPIQTLPIANYQVTYYNLTPRYTVLPLAWFLVFLYCLYATGRASRRAQLMLSQLPEAATAEDYRRALLVLFEPQYGFLSYFAALWLLLGCASVAAYSLFALAAGRLQLATHWHPAHTNAQLPNAMVAASALAGALAWAASEFIVRISQRDLSPYHLLAGCLRIVVAIPIGLGLQSAGVPGAAFFAFAFAAFPVRETGNLMRKLALRSDLMSGLKGFASVEGPPQSLPRARPDAAQPGQSPAAGEPAPTAPGPNRDGEVVNDLEYLQGISRDSALRLEDIGISSIGQLVRADPLELAIRSSFEFNFIVDTINEGILWTYVGTDALNHLRPFGLKGAYALVTLGDEMKNLQRRKEPQPAETNGCAPPETHGLPQGRADELSNATLAALALVLASTLPRVPEAPNLALTKEESLAQAQRLLCTLADNPYSKFICALYRGRKDET